MVKRLMGCIREYKRAAMLTPIYVTMESIMEVIIPFLMARLIDHGIDGGSMPYILKMGAVLVIAAFFAMFFGVLAGKTAAAASAGFGANLRHDMYHNVQDYSFSNIDRFSTASIVTRLTTDVANVQMAYQMIIRVAVRAPTILLFSMIMSFKISPELSLIFLACIPFLSVGLYVIFLNVHPIMERVFKTYDKLNNAVQENLHAIRVVKSFVREDYEEKQFGTVSKSIFDDFSRAEKTLAFNAPLMQFCMYGCILLISWFGARLIVASGNNPAIGMTTGQLMSLMTYVMQILMSLMILSMIFVLIAISRASAERIVEILDEKSDIADGERPVPTVDDGSIRFQDVSFRYAKDRGNLCLSGVTLDIPSGQTVGIIGGTGSSKTTLVQLIPRLHDVTGGSISVGGIDIRDYDIETLRNAVAMVLQKNVLFSGSIKENLRWGNEHATDDEMVHACKLAQADDFVRSFPDGYDSHVEQGGSNLSGGQKQRLCIARALLKKPKILILDDSTSAVDTKTDALIRRALREEIPDTTRLIIAQRISSVQDADQIIVMEGGRLSGVGTHEELLRSNPIYREVYESQTKAGHENG